jgi:Astacin (Peptidase family M12A)
LSSSNPEFGTSTEKETGFISGVTFGPKKVTYQVINGLAIFEGDIVLGTVEEVRKFTHDVETAVVITSRRSRWPSGIVPFDIDPNLRDQARITGGLLDNGMTTVTGAIPHWEANTTIRFIRRTPENASQFPNFVFFEDLGFCFSPVGMLEGRRSISLHPAPIGGNPLTEGCTEGRAIHEIGHTVGLFHEQSREKRDDFVEIHKENIIDDKEDSFDQHISDGDDIGDYDYCSIMHYSENAWSLDPPGNLITIKVLKPELLNPAFPCNGIIGQRNALSAGDMAAVKQMYGVRVLPRYGGFLAGFNNLVGVSAMYNSDDRRHIVVVGTTDGTIHEIFWKSGQVGIEGNEQLPVNFGSGNIVSVSGFYQIHDQLHHMIVGTTNGKIHDIYWKSGQVGIEGNDELPVNLGSGTIVSVSGFYNSDDRRHIVVVGTRNGGVHEIFWKSDSVGIEGHDVLPVDFGHGNIVSVSGFYNSDDRRHIVVVGSRNGRVHEIFWKSDTPGIEGHNDLPAEFGFDGIVSVSGYYSSVDQLLNVIVGIRNGSLFDIHWKSGQAGIFGPSVLTPVPNTRSMIGAAGLYNSHDPRHIVIVGESGRIHELS